MASMLIAWDADGNVIARCSYMARRDENGEVVGHYDFEELESAGYSLTNVWRVNGAVGSGAWPEFLYNDVHNFKVELRPGPKGGEPLISALVHRESGYRRERSDIERRLVEHVNREVARKQARGERLEVDITSVVGGPGDKGLILEPDGRTARPFKVELPDIPYVPAQPAEVVEEAAPVYTASELAAHEGISLSEARRRLRK